LFLIVNTSESLKKVSEGKHCFLLFHQTDQLDIDKHG
jgi:hypothetical protein